MFKMKTMKSIQCYCISFILNRFWLFLIVLGISSCQNSKKFDRFESYLRQVHNIDIYETQCMYVIFVNNIECQQCTQEKIDLIMDFIKVENDKTIGCEFVVHFLKEDPGLEIFNKTKNTRAITGDKYSTFKFGIVSGNDFSFYYQNGKLKRITQL